MNKTQSMKPLRLSLPVLATFIMVVWIFPGLLGHEPWKPDEGYTAGLVLHILQTGDWVVPTLAGEPFMEKPPGYFLTAAFLADVFSPVLSFHDAARLATGLFMAVTFLFTGLAARELFTKEALWIAPLLLAACIGLPIRMHQMITDAALLSGFAIAFYGLSVMTRRSVLGGIWLGTGVGLGFMAKGILAPGIIAIVSLLLPAIHHQWRSKTYLQTIFWAVLGLLPWLLIWPTALYIRSPQLFHDWFWTNNLGRFLGSNNLGPTKWPSFYFTELLWYSLPVWPIAISSLLLEKKPALNKTSLLLPLVYFTTILSVLSISSDARQLYLLPMLVPLSIMAVPGLLGLPDFAIKILSRGGIILCVIAATLLWIICFTMVFGQPDFISSRLAILWPEIRLRVSLPLVIIAAIFSFLWLSIIRWNTRHATQALINWSSGVALLWLLVMTLLLPVIDASKNFKAVFTELGQFLPPDRGCVASQYLGESQRAMLHYYLGLNTIRMETNQQHQNCTMLLIQYRKNINDPSVKINIDNWQKIWAGRRPGDDKEFYVLYKKEVDA